MPESGTNLTMEDLTKLRRAVVAIEAAQRVVASYCGKRDGIAASCRATAWLLDEFYQSETTTTERDEIDRELKLQRRRKAHHGGVRYDLWMRHPDLHGGAMQRISDEHHSVAQRNEFLRTYRAAGWKNAQLRPAKP